MCANICGLRVEFTRPPTPRCGAPVRSPQDFVRPAKVCTDRREFHSTHARRRRSPQPPRPGSPRVRRIARLPANRTAPGGAGSVAKRSASRARPLSSSQRQYDFHRWPGRLVEIDLLKHNGAADVKTKSPRSKRTSRRPPRSSAACSASTRAASISSSRSSAHLRRSVARRRPTGACSASSGSVGSSGQSQRAGWRAAPARRAGRPLPAEDGVDASIAAGVAARGPRYRRAPLPKHSE